MSRHNSGNSPASLKVGWAVVLAVLLVGCQQQTPPVYEPTAGDILFQSLPHNPLIDAIEGATASPFSHCGILHQDGDRLVVIEAIGPVKETPFSEWVAQARDQRYTAFRLKDPYHSQIPAILAAAQTFKGLPYDIHYDMDDEAIYCSELIYKSFLKVTGQPLGRLQKLGDLQWQPHMAVILAIERGNLPLERLMITPRSLSEAPELQRVFSSPSLNGAQF